MVGAGGGFLSVPFMTWCNVKIHNAVATSAALGLPIALAGTVGFIVAGLSVQGMPPHTLGYIYLPALARDGRGKHAGRRRSARAPRTAGR